MDKYTDTGTIAEMDDIYYVDNADFVDYGQIIAHREQRKKDLIGKYVIIVKSRYEKDLDLFLQDNECGSGHWTRFIENARGFYNESTAIVKAKSLQYNNPRVAIIQANGRPREVYNKRTGGH